MEIDKIVLNANEKKMLRTIKKHGLKRSLNTKNLKEIQKLREFGLIYLCDDDRFPIVYDEYGNEEQNAYCVDETRERQYNSFLRAKSAKSFREWTTVIISAIAMLISLLSFAYSIRANESVTKLQEEKTQWQEETLR